MSDNQNNSQKFISMLFALASSDTQKRLEAANYMEGIREHETRQHLTTFIKNLPQPNQSVFPGFEPYPNISILLDGLAQALFDSVSRTRKWTACVLAELGPLDPPRIKGSLAKALTMNYDSREKNEAFYLLYAIFKLGSAAAPDVVAPLVTLLESNQSLGYSSRIAEILASNESDKFFDTEYVAFVLGSIGVVAAPIGVKPLARDFATVSRSVIGVMHSGEALLQMGEAGISALTEFLFDQNYLVRKNACIALAYDGQFTPQIAEALSVAVLGADGDNSFEHRLQAIQAIGRIGKTVAVGAKVTLSKILTDERENAELRFLAAWALEDVVKNDVVIEQVLADFDAQQLAKQVTQREIPAATKTLIAEYQKILPERIANGTTSPFTLLELKQLYSSFGLSRLNIPKQARQGKNYNVEEHSQYLSRRLANLTLADYALCWLGILTLQKIEPIWADFDWRTVNFIIEMNEGDKLWETGFYTEKRPNDKPVSYPYLGYFENISSELIIYCMLQVASGLISGSFPVDDAYEKYTWDFVALGNEYITPYQVSCVYGTALSLIGWVLLMSEDDWRNEFLYETENESKTISESFSGQFPNAAALTYCATDLREPNSDYKSEIYPEIDFEEHPELLRVDRRKLKEFWEWWLREAIQQAWQKALESVARG